MKSGLIRNVVIIMISALLFCGADGCKKKEGAPIPRIPSVLTGTVTQITDYAAVSGGNVTDSFALFQLAAQLTNNQALPGFHSEETRLGLDDQTLKKRFVCQIFSFLLQPPSSAALQLVNTQRRPRRWQHIIYGLGVLVGIPPKGVGV